MKIVILSDTHGFHNNIHIPPGDMVIFAGDICKHGTIDEIIRFDQGCEELFKAIHRVAPQYHVFGHIHEGYGRYKNEKTTFINASICNERYQPINRIQICEL